MNNQPHNFISQVLRASAVVVAVVSVGLGVAGQWRFLAGFVAGAAIAALMFYGVVLVGEAMTRQPTGNGAVRPLGRKVLAVQIAKYVVAVAALYMLINFTQTSPAGIAVGYGTALAVLLGTAYKTGTSREKISSNTHSAD